MFGQFAGALVPVVPEVPESAVVDELPSEVVPEVPESAVVLVEEELDVSLVCA